MTDSQRLIAGGVDTHRDFHVACVVDTLGGELGTERFATTSDGCGQLLEWMKTFGSIVRVGVEGTGSYGAELSRHLQACAVEVREVNRPNRQLRRARGKNDGVDALAAARVAMSNEELAVPKTRTGLVECLRITRAPFELLGHQRTALINQLKGLIVTAPGDLRGQLEGLSNARLIERCDRLRPSEELTPTQITKHTLKLVAGEIIEKDRCIQLLEQRLLTLVLAVNPALLGAPGLGVDTASSLLVAVGDNPDRLKSEAAFAAICGVSPVEASSGKVVSHRLNQGGDRNANRALYVIALSRLNHHGPTRQYVAAREHKSKKALIRCLKRYIARELFSIIVRPFDVIDGHELRTLRTQTSLTLVEAGNALDVKPARLSEIERQVRFDNNLAARYEAWLTAQNVA
jgi:transposase